VKGLKIKEELLSILNKRQFSPFVFEEGMSKAWNDRINLHDDFSLYFNSEILKYEQAYYQKDFSVFSFMIEDIDSICIFKCYCNNQSFLISPLCFDNAFDFNKGIKISKIITSYFKENLIKPQFINLPWSNNLMNHFKLQMLSIGKLKPSLEMYIDLRETSENLWNSIRKSYKSLINYGKKSIIVETEFNKEIWNECKDFHFHIAKRKTRNNQTWEIQRKMLQKNKAKLFYIQEDNKLLGFAFFTLSKSKAIYAVGVFDRSKFEKISIAHIIIWRAIEYFKSNGFNQIYLGEFAPENHLNNQKLHNINHFKLGFCNKLLNNNYLTNE